MAPGFEEKLSELGVNLPEAPAPAANYVPYVQVGDMLYVSGQISIGPEGLIKGKLGLDMTTEQGAEAAKNLCHQFAVASESGMRRRFRSVDPRRQIDRLCEFNSRLHRPSPAVINGASNLLGEALGEAGKTRARSGIRRSAAPGRGRGKLKVFSKFDDMWFRPAIFSEAAGASRLAHRQGGHLGKIVEAPSQRLEKKATGSSLICSFLQMGRRWSFMMIHWIG